MQVHMSLTSDVRRARIFSCQVRCSQRSSNRQLYNPLLEQVCQERKPLENTGRRHQVGIHVFVHLRIQKVDHACLSSRRQAGEIACDRAVHEYTAGFCASSSGSTATVRHYNDRDRLVQPPCPFSTQAVMCSQDRLVPQSPSRRDAPGGPLHQRSQRPAPYAAGGCVFFRLSSFDGTRLLGLSHTPTVHTLDRRQGKQRHLRPYHCTAGSSQDICGQGGHSWRQSGGRLLPVCVP